MSMLLANNFHYSTLLCFLASHFAETSKTNQFFKNSRKYFRDGLRRLFFYINRDFRRRKRKRKSFVSRLFSFHFLTRIIYFAQQSKFKDKKGNKKLLWLHFKPNNRWKVSRICHCVGGVPFQSLVTLELSENAWIHFLASPLMPQANAWMGRVQNPFRYAVKWVCRNLVCFLSGFLLQVQIKPFPTFLFAFKKVLCAC